MNFLKKLWARLFAPKDTEFYFSAPVISEKPGPHRSAQTLPTFSNPTPVIGFSNYILSQSTASTPYGSSDYVPVVQGGGIKKALATSSFGSGANPTATASDVAVNGIASTFMRSDAAPPIQKATSGQFGIVRVDGTSITASSGVISATPTAGVGLFSQALSATPSTASTGLNTWNNQGAAVVTDTTAGIFLDVDSAHNGLAVRQTSGALPGTPYSYVALVSNGPFFSETAGVQPVGIGWTDGTKLHVIYSIGDGGNSLNVAKWTTATAVSANDVTFLSARSGLTWMKIRDDGTNAIFSASGDGVNFVQLFSVAKAAGFLGGAGYTKVCFVAGPNTFAHEVGATLMSWTQGT